MKYAPHITAALYLILHLSASLALGYTWGFDALGYQTGLIVPFVLASALLVFYSFNPGPVSAVTHVLERPFRSPYMLWVLVGVFGVLFVTLSTQTHLLGDGRLLVRELTLGAESPEDRAPLSLFLIRQIYGLVEEAVTAYRVASVGSGLIFILAAYLIARELTTNDITRLGITALLLAQGYVVLFFGYVETYSILFAASGLYVYSAIRSIKGSAPLALPATALSLVICSHVAGLSLIPSFLALVIFRGDRHSLRTLGSLLLVPALVIGLLYLLDYPFSGGADESLVARHTLPVGSPDESSIAYSIFSGPHFLDMINALTLAAPAFVVGLPLFLRGKDRNAFDLWFLTLCLPPLFMTWVINPEIGAFRDWDILAFPAFFLTVALARCLSRISDKGPGLVLLVGVSILHVTPWIVMNSDAEATILRYKDLLSTAPNSQRGTAYGWDSLGGYYREASRYEEAYQAYLVAIEVDPKHLRIRRTAAHTAGKLERFSESVRHFEAAMQMAPDDDTLLSNYAKALLKVGRNSDAARYFEEVLSRTPDQPDLMRLLAAAEFRSGKYDEAMELADTIIARYPPGNVEDHVMIGSIFGLRKDAAGATDSFRNALKIDPRNVDGLHRLSAAYRAADDPVSALAYLRQIPEPERSLAILRAIGSAHYAMGSYDSSAVYYERALRLDERNPGLLYELGSAVLAGGRIQSSIQPLMRAITLDSTIVGAFRNLGTAYADLEQYEKAKEMLRKVIALEPDAPDRDVLAQWIQEH